MSTSLSVLRENAQAIWQAGVDAVLPGPLLAEALAEPELRRDLEEAARIVVVGAGKAGAAMAAAVERLLVEFLPKLEGHINVPAGTEVPTQKIHLHAARPLASNHPTPAGVAGAETILQLVQGAGPDDVVLCLLSGGGSALLPAPTPGVSLADKQTVTRYLHACGASIDEMNAVRKHLSAIKGGRLAHTFAGRRLYSLIISDVVGDPLDVIASGPTAPDPTTFANAWSVLQKYRLSEMIPFGVTEHFQRGVRGQISETPKELSSRVRNRILGNNVRALAVAEAHAKSLGYAVLNLGSYIEGETKQVAVALAGICRSVREQGIPLLIPACILSGGETTVTLSDDPGKGGRNQEFALAFLAKMQRVGLNGTLLLCGGTDGEDGPTDAAGAWVDAETLVAVKEKHLELGVALARNEAYVFFESAGGLLKTGLTQTNVMDVRVLLMHPESPETPLPASPSTISSRSFEK